MRLLMKYAFLAILLISVTISAHSQVLTGHVIDREGKPINTLTIYVPEICQGLITNKDGDFRIALEKGKYTLVSKHWNYKSTSRSIFMDGENDLHIEIMLEQSHLHNTDLPKDESTAHAYSVMDKAIELAPKHHERILKYNSRAYSKGEMTLNYVSKLVDRTIYRFEDFWMSDLKNKVFLQESYNDIDYNFPNNYNITPIASLGSIPPSLTQDVLLSILNGSIYYKEFSGVISPLSPNAKRYYKYSYGGYLETEGKKVHKINIYPKVKSPELMTGDMYISDNDMNVECAHLTVKRRAMKGVNTITYHAINDSISLPITYYNDITFDYIGIDGGLEYYTGFTYAIPKLTKHSLPAATEADYSSSPGDSPSIHKNGAYWNSVRLLPVERDSSRLVADTIDLENRKFNVSKFWLARIILGSYMVGDNTTKFSLRYNGLKMIFRDYNYVDGFWLGNKFDANLRLSGNRSLEAYPYIYYLTARKRLIGGSEFIYNYNLKRKGQLCLDIGSRSEDFSSLSVTRYQNYFASLFFGENYNFFYQRDFLTLNNTIHLNSKFRLITTLGIERRAGLRNHTSFNLLNRNRIKDNIYPDERFDRSFYTIDLSYSPKSNYSITEMLDMHSKRITPIFNLEYEEGFSSWQTNNSKYRKIKGGVAHTVFLDYFNTLDYKLEAGTFITKDKNMHFTDFQHFGSSDMLINLSSLFDSFALLDNYAQSTNKYWINLFLNYSGKYVLFKFIPFLQDKPFTENIHLKTLFTPEYKSYIETGYSVSFNRFFGAGAFMSFHNLQGHQFGVRFSFNLKSLNFL